MVPKPKPLHQGEEYLIGNNVVRILPGHDAQDNVDVVVDERGATSSVHDEGTPQHQPQQPSGSSPAQPLPEQEDEADIIAAPRRSQETETTNAERRKWAIRASSRYLTRKKYPDGARTQGTTSHSSTVKRASPNGIMMQKDDLLDRTFDNVEFLACKDKTTRISRVGPPPPIFTCAATSSVQGTVGSEITELSRAKQLCNAIEMNTESDSDPGGAVGDLGTVNIILDDRSSVIDSNGATQQNQEPTNGSVVGFLIGSVNEILCRETRVASIQLPTTGQDYVKTGEDNISPINLHPIIGVNTGRAMIDPGVHGTPETPSTTKSGCRRSEDVGDGASALTKLGHTVPDAGMLLLPDGSVVSPEKYEAKLQQGQGALKKQHREPDPSIDPCPLRMSRETSLLDLEGGVLGSGDVTAPSSEEVDDRLEKLRQKKRALEERVSHKTVATQTIVIPRGHTSKAWSLNEGAGDSPDSPVSVQQLERHLFRKQVVFAVTFFLVSCALIIFALSFFWPTDRLG
jgi:hypothetical protein